MIFAIPLPFLICNIVLGHLHSGPSNLPQPYGPCCTDRRNHPTRSCIGPRSGPNVIFPANWRQKWGSFPGVRAWEKWFCDTPGPPNPPPDPIYLHSVHFTPCFSPFTSVAAAPCTFATNTNAPARRLWRSFPPLEQFVPRYTPPPVDDLHGRHHARQMFGKMPFSLFS